MFLMDANVLLDITTADPNWGHWSRRALEDATANGGALINPIIYAEVALDFPDSRALDRFLAHLGIDKAPLPYAAGVPASRAYARYRRAGGIRRSPLPDFFIGAHALVAGLRLITRDPRSFRSYFPSLPLITPDPGPGAA